MDDDGTEAEPRGLTDPAVQQFAQPPQPRILAPETADPLADTMVGQAVPQMSGASLEDLNEMATFIREYISSATAESRQVALEAANKRGLISRIFPAQFEREWQRLDMQNPRQLGQAKRELLDVFMKMQIEIARRRADALVAAQGMHLQAELTRFASEKIGILNTAVNGGRERFLNEISPQFDMIEQYQHRPELYEPAYRSLNQQINVYFEATDLLLNGFVQSLSFRVGKIRQ